MDFVSVLQSALESQALDERDKAQRLQTELDVSEQVQKDFVKLSQTLQVMIYASYYVKYAKHTSNRTMKPNCKNGKNKAGRQWEFK